MTDVREKGLQVFRELLPGALPDGDVDVRDGSFGDELLEIGIDNVCDSSSRYAPPTS